MTDHDNSNKPSWFTDEAPRQPSPDASLFGGAYIGKRSATDDLINPNLPVRESGLILQYRARQAAAKQAAEGQEGPTTTEAAPQAAPDSSPQRSGDAPVQRKRYADWRSMTGGPGLINPNLPVRESGLILQYRARQAAAKQAAEGQTTTEAAPQAAPESGVLPTGGAPIQRKRDSAESVASIDPAVVQSGGSTAPDPATHTGMGAHFGAEALDANAAAVQRKATGAATDDHVHEAAQRGVAGGGSALPHLDVIQRLFGSHDVSKIQAHTGDAAARASTEIGAEAYATGDHVAFADAPSLHTAAHEAAHVVQQRGGVQLKGGVGAAGDQYEQHANQVADAVVAGRSAEGLLDSYAGGGGAGATAVQRFGRDEHADIPTKHLIELYAYLRTPDGKKWANDHGYKSPEDLIRRMEADPVVRADNEPVKPGEKKHVAKLHGKKTDFTYGEVTAMMGDLFGHWESLYNANEDQRSHLMGEDTTASNEKYTKGEYLKLASKNDSHFAGKNQDAWLDHHNQAIQLAMKSGSDEMLFEQALFIDAAGGHFLTDAFSAGHQFEKAKIFNAVLIDVNKHFIETDNKQMQAYVGLAGAADPGNIANLVIKAIHDKMNLEGFDVVNGKGMKWKTFGDGNLEKSPETQRIAALAVFESRQQVIGARNAKTPPEVKEVQDFFPTNNTIEKANDYALGLIPWARQQVEKILYDQRGAASSKAGPVGGFIVEHNIEAIGDPARERNILQDQQFDRDHGGSGAGTVAPQFEFRFGK